MEVTGFPPGIELWKAPPMPPSRPRSAPWAPKSQNKLERVKGPNTFTSLGCPFTEPLANPLAVNTKPAPPPIKRMEARRAIRQARVAEGKEQWRAMPKTERAAVARQLVLNERAVAALPPMVRVPRMKAARNTAPVLPCALAANSGAQTDRPQRVTFQIDEDGFSTAQQRTTTRSANALKRRQHTVEYESTSQGEYMQRGINPILARPPGGQHGLYYKPHGVFTNYMNRSVQLHIDLNENAGTDKPKI
jgi:hypothetical protein